MESDIVRRRNDRLVGNLSHRSVENTDWEFSEFAAYDLGQAVAHMTVPAQSLGLSVRQFRAFDRASLEAEFKVPPHWEVMTLLAIRRVGPAAENGVALQRLGRRPSADPLAAGAVQRTLIRARWTDT